MYYDVYIVDEDNVACIMNRNKKEAMRIAVSMYDSNVFDNSYLDEVKNDGEVRVIKFKDFILEC